MSPISTGILILALASALLLAVATAAPLPSVVGYDIEAPEAAVNHRLCADDGKACAEVHATGTVRTCSATTCTVRYTLDLFVSGDRPFCAEVETQPTGRLTNCVVLGVGITAPERVAGEEIYPRNAEGVFREPTRLCIDSSTPAQSCEWFTITVRLAESGSMRANLTASTGASAGRLTLCEENGCAFLPVAARA